MSSIKKQTTKCRLCTRRVRQKAGPGRPRVFCNTACSRRYNYLKHKWADGE